MAITVRSTSIFAPVGMVSASKAADQIRVPRPAGLAVGDLYLIAVVFQSMYGDSSVVTPDGFALMSDRGNHDNRAMAVFGRGISSASDVTDVASVQLIGSSSSTRVVAIGVALRGVDLTDPLRDFGDWQVGNSSPTGVTFPTVPSGTKFGFVYTNSSANTGQPDFTPAGGSVVRSGMALSATNPATAASTGLAVLLGATGSMFQPIPANAGGFQISLRADGEDAVSADPVIKNRTTLAPTSHQPTITSQAVTAFEGPTIPRSSGWLREKRVGYSETIPGAVQPSTADIDLTGSTRFAFPGVPSGVVSGDPASPSQYVRSDFKPGVDGASSSNRWLFNVSFVLRGTNVVEFRHRAPVDNPIFGRVYVNGQPIEDYATQLTGITAGQGYSVKLTFPTSQDRIITIYGLGQNMGSWGGVAVGPGGSVKKPTATIKRRIAFIGDSYVNGIKDPPASARATETLIWRLAWLMGADEVISAGINATGFNAKVGSPEIANSNFIGRVPAVLAMNPHAVVILGGRADTPYTSQATADTLALVNAIKAQVSEIHIVPTASDTQSSIRSDMLAAALATDTGYYDVKFKGRIELGADRATPTYSGHQEMADQAYALMHPDKVVTSSVEVVQGSSRAPAELLGISWPDISVRKFVTLKYQVKPHRISDLLAENPFYIAHRGSGDNWPEHTYRAYSNSIAHGMKAIEVSANRSSDGVFICHHDSDTQRMCGQKYVITETPWSVLETLSTTALKTDNIYQSRPSISLLVDVLDDFAATQVIFIEDKSGANALDLLDLMDTYPNSTNHFVWKAWAGAGQYAAAQARGYKSWGFFMSEDLVNLPVWGARHHFLGADLKMTDAEISSVVSYGLENNKPVISWEIHTPADRARAMRLGVKGMMTSNILAVRRAPL